MPDQGYAELWTGIRAARRAGELLSEHAAHRGTATGPGSVGPDVDQRSEQTIIEVIHEEFPGHNIVSEESRPEFAAKPRWIIDPLDGTVNLRHGVPHFAVSIAFEGVQAASVGIVYHVPSDTMYTAVQGEGAYANGRQLQPSDTEEMSNALIVTGFDPATMRASDFGQFQSLLSETEGVRRFGSAASELSMVASGRFDAFFERMLSVWDTAAGTMIVEEAGGEVTRVDPIRGNNEMILASNEHLHTQLVSLISSKTTSER